MSAVMERGEIKPEVFGPVGYFDTRVVGANVVRWVFNPLDLIVPERKAEISWLRVGGEETPCPCLQRHGRGFIPRGRAAVLEMGGEPIPMRHLGDLQAVAWQGIPLNADAVKNKFGFVPVFPGDGLRVLLRYSMNDGGIRKGIDEDTALMGKEWDECHNEVQTCPNGHFTSPAGQPFVEPECPTCKQPWIVKIKGTGILDVIETAMFGDGIEPTLRGLEDQIRFADAPNMGIDLGKMKSDRLRMCEDARNWASRKISFEHGLLKTGHVGEWQGGWSYSYSPITEMLLEQLEIPRQDQPLQEMSRMVAQLSNQPLPQSQGMSAADMEMFERKMDERLALARQADAQRIAELEAKLAATPQVTVDSNISHEAVEYDLTGERPEGVHHKTWEKMRREAGLE